MKKIMYKIRFSGIAFFVMLCYNKFRLDEMSKIKKMFYILFIGILRSFWSKTGFSFTFCLRLEEDYNYERTIKKSNRRTKSYA